MRGSGDGLVLDHHPAPGRRGGLFFCRCAGNLGAIVPLDELEQERWRGVAAVASHAVLCSEEGRRWFADEVRARRLERVVVAACSPREHEATFRVPWPRRAATRRCSRS